MLATTNLTTRKPFTALDDPKQLADYLKTSQPTRWNKFHTGNPRILIVDDNPRTLERLAASIYELYGVWPDMAQHGFGAQRKVRDAKEDGRPYKLMITDLHMPEMTGMALTKSLGADCPPTIWHTSSSMNDELANLSIQMDRYEAANAMELLREHVMEKRPSSLPLAAIFIALKDQPLLNLVNQIDAALLVQEQNSDCASLNAEFLKVYEPTLIPPNLTSRSVHEILEEIRNATLLIEPLISKLRQQGLNSNSWWSQNSAFIEGALEALREAHFRNIPMESTEMAWDRIHNLLGEFQNLAPSGLEFSDNPEASKLVSQWQEVFYKYREILSGLGNNLRAYARGELDLNLLVKDAAEENGINYSCRSAFTRSLPLFMDRDRRVRSLLVAMVDRFHNRL